MHGAPLRALYRRVRALLPNYKCSILMSNYDLLILHYTFLLNYTLPQFLKTQKH